MEVKRDGPYIPEHDLTPEQRLDAIAEILLDAIREMLLQQNRDKVRRCRARKKGLPVDADPAEPEQGAPTVRARFWPLPPSEQPPDGYVERFELLKEPPARRRPRAKPDRKTEATRPFKIVPPGE